MKIRKAFLTGIVAVLIVCLLCSCGDKKKAPEIREEIISAYHLTYVEKETIAGIFAKADKAWDKMVKDAEEYGFLSNNIMLECCGTLSDLSSDLDDIASVSHTVDSVKWGDLVLEEMELYLASSKASFQYLDALEKPELAEATFEELVNVLNGYFNFFYGEEWITDDEMDALEPFLIE